MQLITWLLRLIIFVFFVSFAAENSETINLYYFQNQSFEMPLSVALLIFFALGVMLTLMTVPRKAASKKSKSQDL